MMKFFTPLISNFPSLHNKHLKVRVFSMFQKLMVSEGDWQDYYVNEKLKTNGLNELFFEKRLYFNSLFNPFQPSVAFHIETSHLICTANQMTGFYLECKTGLKWVNSFHISVFFYFIAFQILQ